MLVNPINDTSDYKVSTCLDGQDLSVVSDIHINPNHPAIRVKPISIIRGSSVYQLLNEEHIVESLR